MTSSNNSKRGDARYLVTGAKGFIGAWTVKSLVERGDRPFIFDTDPDAHRLKALLTPEQMQSFTFIRGDITNFEEVARSVAEFGITHIIHFAGLQVPTCAANPRLGAQVNVGGTLNVFEAARLHRDTVRKVVYASSAAVFGPEEYYGSAKVPEGAPLEPTNHYGVFKQCNEGNARIYFKDHGISSAGLRPWAVYGVGRDVGMTSAPTKAIKAAVLGRPYTIKFTGGIDLQYVNDTARIFIGCADLEVPGARVYTLRGEVIRVEEFLLDLQREIPAARELIRAEGKALSIAYDLDDSALVRDLKNVPRTPLAEGIRETSEIFRRLQREGRLETRDLEN